jgi:PAS domain S-box-containing protein
MNPDGNHEASHPAPAGRSQPVVPVPEGYLHTSVDEYFVNLFNHVQEAIAIHDITGRIVRVNGEFERLFGYPDSEIRGQLTDELIVPPDRMAEATEYTKAVARGETVASETCRKRRDGTLIDVSLLCAPIVLHGEQVAAYGIYRDITERKAAEAQREYFANLFNTVREAIAILDNDGQILQVNGEFERLFGFGNEEVQGRRIDDLIVPPAFADEGSHYTQEVLNGEIFSFETRRQRKDGSLVDVSLICAPILVRGHQVAAYGIYRDITDRRTAEVQLAESHRKITDSIHYAQLIQASLLPKPSTLESCLSGCFVLYRPRDIVGGDFYDVVGDPEGCLVAVADCTGHGVPGAFMTMSAHAVLTQLLAKHGPEDPALLLQEMNRALKGMLHQGGQQRERGHLDHGLELALVRIRARDRRLRYAGARIPLWLWRPDGQSLECPADTNSLGYRRSSADCAFANRDLEFPTGTSCYLFTDGLLDQHGGPLGFGFGKRRLRELLNGIQALPMEEQGRLLEQSLHEYQGQRPQRDDITMLGFRP